MVLDGLNPACDGHLLPGLPSGGAIRAETSNYPILVVHIFFDFDILYDRQ